MTTATETPTPALTRKDFASPVAIRWCPGCGDYSILTAVQGVLPTLGIPKEKFVFVSGIGCSSRFPYYMNTYGFHTIHGRAPAVATGVKVANPDLQVWVITGDGDSLSIGGNHFIHALRRNVDLKIILFNNRIYGLTKGQYSPTSAVGTVSPSTPFGSVDLPLSPLSLALGAEASFVARTSDNDVKHMTEVFQAAAAHKGSALVEVMQNCVIFADDVHEPYYGRNTKQDTLLYLKHGEPMRFGKEHEKGIVLNGLNMATKVNPSDGEVLVHDEKETSGNLAFMLSRFAYPDFPVPVGVFRSVQRPLFHEAARQQVDTAKQKTPPDLGKLFNSGSTWVVE
ncbi:MAG TPA: 2-oxoacid:ferredoxin oxidoreductase subunit beta [Fibrobacteres bacterium]|jgi:2-oxoglutarate ferredoxin oxidoreductase subunit beta|nr:2-oxoacid:ferredoxin oxidoreductase subunit beta [Fibrobacterota bacterium]